MIEADKRKAVFLLHQEGMSINEIARRLHLQPQHGVHDPQAKGGDAGPDTQAQGPP